MLKTAVSCPVSCRRIVPSRSCGTASRRDATFQALPSFRNESAKALCPVSSRRRERSKLTINAEQDQRVADWLVSNLAELRRLFPDTPPYAREVRLGWNDALATGNFIALDWPKEFGGLELPAA